MRGRSLAVRLAVLLAGVVVVVLVVAGLVVNRAASRSLAETLGPREEQRLSLAGALVEQGLERGIGPRGMQRLLHQIAADSHGHVRIIDSDGSVVLEAGPRVQGGEAEALTTPLSEAAGGGSLIIEVPSPTPPFLRAFNGALIVTGAVAVVALLGAAAIVATRLTRPLREVAQAAHRLGEGDLAVRATGGPDAESAELADAFNGMADRLERSEILRRRAASDLAHDLATPATVLESQIQAMVDGIVPADAAQLEKARAAAASLSSVIAQLGELTQAESAPLARSVEPVGLVALAEEAIASLEALARQRRVGATAEGSEITVRVDRGQVSRALRNVLTNAIQHAPEGSVVRVVVDADPAPTILIIDTGPGISPEDLPYVFERFYRADRSRGRSGSGIGLTVARELIAANGGTTEVEATGPSGTTFAIRLPPMA